MVFIYKTKYYRISGPQSAGLRAHTWYLANAKKHDMEKIEVKDRNGKTMTREEIREYLNHSEIKEQDMLERRTVISPEQKQTIKNMDDYTKNFIQEKEKQTGKETNILYVTHESRDKEHTHTHIIETGEWKDIRTPKRELEDLKEMATEKYHHLELEKEHLKEQELEKQIMMQQQNLGRQEQDMEQTL